MRSSPSPSIMKFTYAASSIRMQSIPVVRGPGGNTILVGRIWIRSDNHLAPFGMSIAPWGKGLPSPKVIEVYKLRRWMSDPAKR